MTDRFFNVTMGYLKLAAWTMCLASLAFASISLVHYKPYALVLVIALSIAMKAGYNLVGYLRRRGGEHGPANYAGTEFDRIDGSDYVGDVSIRGDSVQMSVRAEEDVLLIRIREENGLSRIFVLNPKENKTKRNLSNLAADLGAMVLPIRVLAHWFR
jgi:hypothetical protein